KKRINTAPLDVEIQHPAIEQQSDNNEAVIQLYKAIRTLAETDRAIISLHLDGYDHSEIASIMGISANNAGVKLYRIKNHLTNLLNPQ
ncbi:MAG: RNA polymerase sigma factor, partial [Ferruginibacter sp.]